jgi:hypothetical protein
MEYSERAREAKPQSLPYHWLFCLYKVVYYFQNLNLDLKNYDAEKGIHGVGFYHADGDTPELQVSASSLRERGNRQTLFGVNERPWICSKW